MSAFRRDGIGGFDPTQTSELRGNGARGALPQGQVIVSVVGFARTPVFMLNARVSRLAAYLG